MTVLLGETAADNKSPLGLNLSESSLTKAANPAFSSANPFLQSTCQQTGYSQSRSKKYFDKLESKMTFQVHEIPNPSNPCFSINSIT